VFVQVVKYLTSLTQLIVSYYKTWLHVSTNYVVILRPLTHKSKITSANFIFGQSEVSVVINLNLCLLDRASS
jgi:hypothetical protein